MYHPYILTGHVDEDPEVVISCVSDTDGSEAGSVACSGTVSSGMDSVPSGAGTVLDSFPSLASSVATLCHFTAHSAASHAPTCHLTDNTRVVRTRAGRVVKPVSRLIVTMGT